MCTVQYLRFRALFMSKEQRDGFENCFNICFFPKQRTQSAPEQANRKDKDHTEVGRATLITIQRHIQYLLAVGNVKGLLEESNSSL
jgi:hypothetical protein